MTSTSPTMTKVLQELGVTQASLPIESADSLTADGYAVLTQGFSMDLLEELRSVCDRLEQSSGFFESAAVHPDSAAPRLSDLFNEDPVFLPCMTHPAVLAAAHRLLGDFRVNSLNYRSAPPGAGHQLLHPDWTESVADGECHVVNSIWLLDDFTTDNGATRLVPRSHRSKLMPSDVMTDISDDHPDQVVAQAPAGSILVFNGHLWHGGTRNRTDRPRRALTMSYCRRDEPQQLDQQRAVRKWLYDRLTSSQRFLLDV